MTDEPSAGALIRRARQLKRMKQRDLAKAVGVHETAVWAWEHDRYFPTRNAALVEEVLGITLVAPEPVSP